MQTITATILTLTSILPNLKVDFEKIAAKHEIPAKLLEGICRYESDHGRLHTNQNRDGSWDVGLCQNHRKPSQNKPTIPSHHASAKEAAKELAHWKKEHDRYCVKKFQEEGACGEKVNGRWRGIKNCHLEHAWWSHYNYGYRVFKRDYGKRVFCFTTSNFSKCEKEDWSQINFEGPRPLEINNELE